MSKQHRRSGYARESAFVLIAVLSLLGSATDASAQALRGMVRSGSTLLPLEGATVTVRSADSTLIGRVVTDVLGGYAVGVRADMSLVVEVRRLGYQVSKASVQALAGADTVEFEFLMTEVAVATDAVVVTGEAGLNDRRLAEANRRGWKVYEPELVMRHRERASTFNQLLQSMGNPGLILPRNPRDCIRATRNNNCLTLVVDNQVLGTQAIILPSDVYFLAILSASDSRIQFGERAPYGAIVVYTRSRLDRVQPDRPRNADRRRP
jgi:hypothetical protein